MNKYFYKGKDSKGKLIKGFYEARNKSEVAYMLKEKGYFPIVIKNKWYFKYVFNLKKLVNSITKQVGLKDLVLFCRQFSTMLGAGLPVMESLNILFHQTHNKNFRKIIESLRSDLEKGKLLSEALGNYPDVFPEIVVSMIEAGEASGTLSKVFEQLANYFEKENELREKIKTVTSYPIVLSIVAFFVITFLVTKVLPTFVNLFTEMGASLPLPTKIILTTSSLLSNYWYILLVFFLIFAAIFKRYTSGKGKKKIDQFKLKLPIIGLLNQKILLSRFSRTLSALIGSGITILQALEIVRKVVQNEIIRQEIDHIKDSVRKGYSIATTIQGSKIFPPMVVQMIRIGEESGTLEEMLSKIADYYENETKNMVERLSSLVEPALILLMAFVVGFIVISVVVPMLEIYDMVG